MLNVAFHAVMALVDAMALTSIARRPGLGRLTLALAAAGLAVFILAAVLGVVAGNGFAQIRFLAHGVFIHGPLGLAAAAWILRRQPREALACAALAVALAGVAVHAFWIEPTRLEVTRHTLRSPKLTEPVRVLVLADYQTDAFGPYERRVWDTAMAQDADVVLLPGDYIQIGDTVERARVRRETRDYLEQVGFSARRGVYAVRGDVEWHDPDWAELFRGLPVTTLEATHTLELAGLTLTALAANDSRDRTLTVPPSPRFHVVFGHAPDFALNGLDAELLIAGHTHGGQVRLPWIGPLLTLSAVPRSWAAGMTDLGGGRTLLVSRGIGMERGWAPRLRFLCRPELVVLDLAPD